VGLPVTEEAVLLALRKLERAHLLMEKLGTASELTRRDVLRKAGRLGVCAAVTPLVASALIPVAAAALSPECTGQTCGFFTPGCSSNRSCLCWSVCSGGGICTPDAPCEGAGSNPDCGPGNTCAPGRVCVCNTCCTSPKCVAVADICTPASVSAFTALPGQLTQAGGR
jgi:hypothetical protein